MFYQQCPGPGRVVLIRGGVLSAVPWPVGVASGGGVEFSSSDEDLSCCTYMHHIITMCIRCACVSCSEEPVYCRPSLHPVELQAQRMSGYPVRIFRRMYPCTQNCLHATPKSQCFIITIIPFFFNYLYANKNELDCYWHILWIHAGFFCFLYLAHNCSKLAFCIYPVTVCNDLFVVFFAYIAQHMLTCNSLQCLETCMYVCTLLSTTVTIVVILITHSSPKLTHNSTYLAEYKSSGWTEFLQSFFLKSCLGSLPCVHNKVCLLLGFLNPILTYRLVYWTLHLKIYTNFTNSIAWGTQQILVRY